MSAANIKMARHVPVSNQPLDKRDSRRQFSHTPHHGYIEQPLFIIQPSCFALVVDEPAVFDCFKKYKVKAGLTYIYSYIVYLTFTVGFAKLGKFQSIHAEIFLAY